MTMLYSKYSETWLNDKLLTGARNYFEVGGFKRLPGSKVTPTQN